MAKLNEELALRTLLGKCTQMHTQETHLFLLIFICSGAGQSMR